MVSRVGVEAKQRRVWEVVDSAAGLPPPPLRSAYTSRSPSSRQVLLLQLLFCHRTAELSRRNHAKVQVIDW